MNRRLNKLLSWASGDTGLKIFSVLFAIGLWLFVNAGQKPTEKSLTVPVEVRNMPADLMMGNPGPGQVEIRVAGPPALLSTLDPDYLKVVLDLDGAHAGTSTFRLSPGFFNPPRGVRIARISPAVINLKLETRGERVLPVTVRLGSKPPPGYKIVRADDFITGRRFATKTNGNRQDALAARLKLEIDHRRADARNPDAARRVEEARA